MVAPINNSINQKTIKLLQQEKEGKYAFDGQFVVTGNAIDKFGHEVIAAACIILLKKVKEKGGLDYLQVFEIDGEKLWFIDDVLHVTCLLPEDY
ncbi:MAG: hypothetical protein ABR969_00805 [Sedimentisphaerales bacterium]|jgi:hypothetical protein